MAIICRKIMEGNNPHKDNMTSIKINKIEDLILSLPQNSG